MADSKKLLICTAYLQKALEFFQGVKKGLLKRVLESSPLPIPNILERLKGKVGLEIGGPSPVFSKEGELPVYPIIKSLDNCNFSTETLWREKIEEGLSFDFEVGKPTGHQYISEATDLRPIGFKKYDFVLSSHTLEHIANPLKALSEWLRVIKPGGFLLLVLPFKEGCFDHRRPVTSFAHLMEDFRNDMGEDDSTHLDEVLRLHDLSRDPEAGSFEEFKKLSLENFKNRRLHHHVFNESLLKRVFQFSNLKPIFFKRVAPFHLIVMGQK